MEDETKAFPLKICRTCLCESNELKPISSKIADGTRSILDTLSFVMNIDIIVHKNLPDHVCSDCESILSKADAFKHRFLEVETVLNKYVKFSKNKIINNIKRKSAKLTGNENSKQLTESSDSLVQNSGKEIATETKKNQNMGSVNTESIFDDDIDISFLSEEDKNIILKILLASFEPTDEKMQITVTEKSENSVDNKKRKMEKKEKKSCATKEIVIKKFQCETCSKTFPRLSVLRHHMMSHTTAEEPHLCPICGKSIKQDLKQHMRRHQGYKPFVCEICDKGFVVQPELNKHRRRVHKKDKSFVCAECGAGFSAVSNLYSHQRRIHIGEKRHACKVCSKRFFESNEVTKHMIVHTSEKPFVCFHCDKRFSRKYCLTTHLKLHQGKMAANTDTGIIET